MRAVLTKGRCRRQCGRGKRRLKCQRQMKSYMGDMRPQLSFFLTSTLWIGVISGVSLDCCCEGTVAQRPLLSLLYPSCPPPPQFNKRPGAVKVSLLCAAAGGKPAISWSVHVNCMVCSTCTGCVSVSCVVIFFCCRKLSGIFVSTLQ